MARGLSARLVLASIALVGASALATPPAPLVPRTPTGFSTVEQRHVYAPPDEGSFEVPLRLGLANPNEVLIEEPIQCRPEAKAWARVTYSKSKNSVVLEAWYEGLPYRMSYTRPTDISTPYNQFPQSVKDGKWQIWFVGRLLSFRTTFYYDATTRRLIGHAQDLPNGPPPNSIPVQLPTLHMIGTPIFEGTPDGKARVRFEYRYDQMLDEVGKGGVYYSYPPTTLCEPDGYSVYYTDGGLPPSLAMNFDQVLESIWSGHGMMLATSLEPDPKPDYLISRDNLMITWAGMYPINVPEGVEFDLISRTVRNKETCGTRILPAFPKARYNLCPTSP
jgi:hypothetical protein